MNKSRNYSSVRLTDEDLVRILTQCEILHPDGGESDCCQRLLQVISSNSASLIDQLFPGNEALGPDFYDVMGSLRKWIGFGEKSNEAIGHLWVAILKRLETKLQEQVLSLLITHNGRHFFTSLSCLHVVLAHIDFSAEFLAQWFMKVFDLLKNDMAQGGFWKGLGALCQKNYSKSIEIVTIELANGNSESLQIVSFLIGELRGIGLDDLSRKKLEEVENRIAGSPELKYRSCYNWSWATTAQSHSLTEKQFDFLIQRAEQKKYDDYDNLLGVISRVVIMERVSGSVLVLAGEWISVHASPMASVNTKYHIANSASMLERKYSQGKLLVDCSTWVTSIQPVLSEQTSIWWCIEAYLVKMLDVDIKKFEEIFERLSRMAGNNIINLMRMPQGMDWLIDEMKSQEVGVLVGHLMMSSNKNSRRLGLELFNKLSLEVISSESFLRNGIWGIRLLFYESQCMMLNGQVVARLFVSFIPLIDSKDLDFRNEVKQELKLQARNYGGSCRAELLLIGSHVDMVKEILVELESYFEGLKASHGSGINQMSVPGAQQAGKRDRQKMSRRISDIATEHSVMIKMSKKVQLLYGHSSSHFMDGGLSDSRMLSEISNSIEIPFVDFSDPEYMALRRLNAHAQIEEVLSKMMVEGASNEK